MENFEFKSQICTTKPQSEALLALGLKKETADMMYITDGRVPEEYRHYDLVTEYYESCLEDMVHIPAWSLHRLIMILYNGTSESIKYLMRLGYKELNYDTIITCIEDLIKLNQFNKDYLEEKK